MTPATATALATYQDDQEVLEAQVQAQTVADAARALTIVDDATNGQALELLARCRKVVRSIEDKKKEWLDPLNAQIKKIRGDMDAMAAPAKEADGILAQKVSAYRAKVAELARKEQERLRLLAEKRQAAAAVKAEAKGLEAPPVIPLAPTVAAPAKTVQVESGGITFRKQVHYEISDPAQVPAEYWVIDEKKVGAAVRAGIAVAGVRTWITEEATVR